MEDLGDVDFSSLRPGALSTHVRRENVYRNEDNVFKDISSFGVPDHIAKTATHKFFDLIQGRIFREKPRDKHMFFCIYQAYLEHGIHKDPFILCKKLGLSSPEMTGACMTFSISPGLRSKIVFSRPQDFIIELSNLLGLKNKHQEELFRDIVDTVEKVPALLTLPPCAVARVFLYLYCEKHKLLSHLASSTPKQKEKFCEHVHISVSNLENMKKKVLKMLS